MPNELKTLYGHEKQCGLCNQTHVSLEWKNTFTLKWLITWVLLLFEFQGGWLTSVVPMIGPSFYQDCCNVSEVFSCTWFLFTDACSTDDCMKNSHKFQTVLSVASSTWMTSLVSTMCDILLFHGSHMVSKNASLINVCGGLLLILLTFIGTNGIPNSTCILFLA